MHRIVIVLLVLMAMLAVAGAGQACCIYNNATLPLKIWGPHVDWIVAPSNHRCTDGTGGKFKFEVLNPWLTSYVSMEGEMEVDDHGWLSIYPRKGDTWHVVSKKKDGSIKHEMQLDKLKKSPEM